MDSELRALILQQARKYHQGMLNDHFVPGVTPILSSGAVLDKDDRAALVGAALDMRIAAGAQVLP